MRTYRYFLPLFVAVFMAASSAFADSKNSDNPFLPGLNQKPDYALATAQSVRDAVKISIADAKASLEKIYAVKKQDRNFENTMRKLDDTYHKLNTTYALIYLQANVSSDDSVRIAGSDGSVEMQMFFNELAIDENLYKAVKEYSETSEGKELAGYKKKYLTETLRDFERSGFALPKEKRLELKNVQDKISELENEFSKNIAEYDDYLFLDENDMKGMDDDYKNARLVYDGKYKVGLDYPSYIPFMKYAKSDRVRKDLYFKYNNRAAAKNLPVLDSLLIYRAKLAGILGYKTYAEYQTAVTMSKNPKAIWDFENSLIDKVKEKAKKDYAELLEMKKEYTGNQNASEVYSWESSFYNNLLIEKKYSLDQNALREYFPLNEVMNGMFEITKTMFGIDIQEDKSVSVWHKDVKAYKVTENGKTAAYFYIDLFPRKNKFSHAASFPMTTGKNYKEGYQLPEAALVCNFSEPTEDKPALLTHDEVETLFHEFGHVLHHLLSKTDLSSQSGFSTTIDYVETPSQTFEDLVWNYDALKLFAKHYKTGEVLPKETFDKMTAAKNVGSGNATLAQIYYGLIDLTLHDKYDPAGKTTTTDVVKKLQNETMLYKYLEDTHMQAAFGHLTDYAAGYYGYLWAKVFAEDIYSQFEKNGIFDKETGMKFRKIILEKGASEDPMNLVKEFLGREPSQEPFLKSIGL